MSSTDKLDQMKRITTGVGRYYQTSWTPDDKIIYVSEESGNQDIWTMDADGSGAKQLTYDSATDCYPRVTPDGRYIVFASNRDGTFHLWRMDRDGGNLLQLTAGNGETFPDFSPDSKFVYFMANVSEKWYISKTSIDGGQITQIFDFPSKFGVVSPDGKKIICLFLDEQTNAKWQIGIASLSENKLIKIPEISDTERQFLSWTSDGQAITYTSATDNLQNLWNYPLNGDLPKQATRFNSSDQIFYFDWSSDGKNLVCLRGQRTNDVVFLNGN
jgi:TolB protein